MVAAKRYKIFKMKGHNSSFLTPSSFLSSPKRRTLKKKVMKEKEMEMHKLPNPLKMQKITGALPKVTPNLLSNLKEKAVKKEVVAPIKTEDPNRKLQTILNILKAHSTAPTPVPVAEEKMNEKMADEMARHITKKVLKNIHHYLHGMSPRESVGKSIKIEVNL